MNNKNSDLICQKDEKTARKAAEQIIANKNINEFKALCEKMDYIFDFIRDNVYKRLNFAINENNFKNILTFFEIYSPYFDDFFVSVLSKYADEDLTDEILDIFENGTDEQKAYCANYFKKIPDTVAKSSLISNLDTGFEPLFTNCAMALGRMKDDEIFNHFIGELNSDDEFTKLKAVKFLVAYGDTNVVDSLLETMTNSSMSENIAGEITTLIPPFELFNINFRKGAILFNQLICGLGEILPLENLLYYEIPYITDFLIENTDISDSVVLLFNLKNKIEILTQNDEYIFDLDKNTKNEILNLKTLLKQQSFWNDKKLILKEYIDENNPFLNTVLEIIREENIVELAQDVAKLISSKNETLICEATYTLKKLNSLNLIDKSKITINNANLKAIFEQHFLLEK